jgi:hypothetical protein
VSSLPATTHSVHELYGGFTTVGLLQNPVIAEQIENTNNVFIYSFV